MFIELTEYLRCPESHAETYCVLVPETIVERRVTRGSIGCPTCRREYPIVEGIVEFGFADVVDYPAADSLPDPQVVQALLGLGSPGGFVALIGSAASGAPQLTRLLDGVHFVGVNPPPDVEASRFLSPLRSARGIPLKTGVARGVVVGADHARPPWLEDGVRVLLRGQRIVVLRELGELNGVERLAVGDGLWVGSKLR